MDDERPDPVAQLGQAFSVQMLANVKRHFGDLVTENANLIGQVAVLASELRKITEQRNAFLGRNAVLESRITELEGALRDSNK